jgi:hypothetical protein
MPTQVIGSINDDVGILIILGGIAIVVVVLIIWFLWQRGR